MSDLLVPSLSKYFSSTGTIWKERRREILLSGCGVDGDHLSLLGVLVAVFHQFSSQLHFGIVFDEPALHPWVGVPLGDILHIDQESVKLFQHIGLRCFGFVAFDVLTHSIDSQASIAVLPLLLLDFAANHLIIGICLSALLEQVIFRRADDSSVLGEGAVHHDTLFSVVKACVVRHQYHPLG